MKMTVILPTYNRAAFIGLAVRSLLMQSDAADIDVLIVDDGSSDDTPEILRKLARDNACIRVLTQKNAGIAPARNTGLANLLPETELVTFLDSDDISPPGRFAADLPLFDVNQDLELTYGRMLLVEDIDYSDMTPAENTGQVDIRGIQLACGIFRRGLIDRVGRFDEEFLQAEDTDFMLRVFESDPNYKLTDTYGLYYLRHPGNVTKRLDESRRSFMRALHKSILRRKKNPGIILRKPAFEVKAITDTSFY